MSRRNVLTDVSKFCQHHLGKGCFAPFTGQDASAWAAFVYAVEMYGRGDEAGRHAAIAAMGSLLNGAQAKADVHQVFLQSIPAVLDWIDGPRIWSLMRAEGATPFDLQAVQRREVSRC